MFLGKLVKSWGQKTPRLKSYKKKRLDRETSNLVCTALLQQGISRSTAYLQQV